MEACGIVGGIDPTCKLYLQLIKGRGSNINVGILECVVFCERLYAMQPEDSDEEWQRIASHVDVVEARYLAERGVQGVVGEGSGSAAAVVAVGSNEGMQGRVGGSVVASGVASGSGGADMDPYVNAIQSRDAQIAALKLEQQGEVANYRNKIRVLQTQLATARTQRVGGDMTRLEEEKERVVRELEAVQRRERSMGERLAFVEQELKQARERERKVLVGVREEVTQVEVVEATQVGRPKSVQGFSMGGVRVPVKRKRRAREGKGVEKSVERSSEDGGKSGSRRERDVEEHGWGVRLSDGVWEDMELRRRVFGGRLGRELMEIVVMLKVDPLREQVLKVMSGGCWTGLMAPLEELMQNGRGGVVIAMQVLGLLLTWSEQCRKKISEGVLWKVRKCLEKATKEKDQLVAECCLKVMTLAGEADKDAVRCEAVLDWILADAKTHTRHMAVALVERICEWILEGGDDRAEEWEFVERAVLLVSKCVTTGQADNFMLKCACAMLMRAALRAPYVVHDFGGAEAAAHAFICASRHGKAAEGFVTVCANILCTAAKGVGGANCGLAVHTRNALLGIAAEQTSNGNTTVLKTESGKVLRMLCTAEHKNKSR